MNVLKQSFTNSNKKVLQATHFLRIYIQKCFIQDACFNYIPVSQQGYWGSEAWLIFTYNAVYGWVKDLSEMDIFNNLMAQ